MGMPFLQGVTSPATCCIKTTKISSIRGFEIYIVETIIVLRVIIVCDFKNFLPIWAVQYELQLYYDPF